MLIVQFAQTVCVSLWLGGVAPQKTIDADVYTKPATLVSVGSHRRLNLYCVGEGQPTVVLEAGAASSMVVWGFVQPRVAERTRVCSYDRAGMGFSDQADRPSDASNIVEDLHSLLLNAHEAPPYLLAAHSSGALYARLYAARYPDEVVGFVLVDPASEYGSDAYRSVDPRRRSAKDWHDQVEAKEQPALRRCVLAAERDTLKRGSAEWKQCIDEPAPVFSDRVQAAIERFEAGEGYQRAALSEDEEFATSESELRESSNRFVGMAPLIVLTSHCATAPSWTARTLAERYEHSAQKFSALSASLRHHTQLTRNGVRCALR